MRNFNDESFKTKADESVKPKSHAAVINVDDKNVFNERFFEIILEILTKQPHIKEIHFMVDTMEHNMNFINKQKTNQPSYTFFLAMDIDALREDFSDNEILAEIVVRDLYKAYQPFLVMN